MVYTKKFAADNIQMYLFRNTRDARNSLCSAPPRASASSVPATSGNPTDGGVSGRNNHRQTAAASAMAAGTKKHNRQFTVISAAHSTRIRMLPILCDEFQIENFVASSFGENQFATRRAHGGKPMP